MTVISFPNAKIAPYTPQKPTEFGYAFFHDGEWWHTPGVVTLAERREWEVVMSQVFNDSGLPTRVVRGHLKFRFDLKTCLQCPTRWAGAGTMSDLLTYRPMLHNASFQSLERRCRMQASLTSEPRTRRVLEEMADEYKRMAGHQEQDDQHEHSEKKSEAT
jgi:hypothetical protein